VLGFTGIFIMEARRHKSTWLAANQGLMFSWLAIQSVVRDRLELRERGVFWSTPLRPGRVIRWGEIEGFEWKHGTNHTFTKESERKDYLALTVRKGSKRRIVMPSVSRALQEAAQAVVEQRIDEAAQSENRASR
jgi:hypothetical protein